jgi:hypothetical protein
MKPFDWLMTGMGFTYRQVAAALCISTTALHNAQTGTRNLPSMAREILDHPLFQVPTNLDEILPPVWSDQNDEDRIRNWTIRRILAANRIGKLKVALQKLEERNRQLQRIQNHGGEIQIDSEENEIVSVVKRWWILQKSKAATELQKLNRARFEEIKLQIALADTEIQMLDSFLK